MTDAVMVLRPAKSIGGRILVEWATIIGKSEYIKVSNRISASPFCSLLRVFMCSSLLRIAKFIESFL